MSGANMPQTAIMVRRLLLALPLVVALALAALPEAAVARQPAAAKVAEPRVQWVRVERIVPAAGEPTRWRDRVVVRVLVRHAPLADPAPGVRTIGTVTVVLSRYVGERDYSIGGGSSSFALPVVDRPLSVAYRIVLNGPQSANVRRAAAAGTLRAMVLFDQRAQAKGRAAALAGGFAQATPKLADVGAVLGPAVPPLLERGVRGRTIVGADRQGRPVVEQAEVALDAGRRLVLAIPEAARPVVPADGAAVALPGTIRILGPDGAQLAELPAPEGFSLAVRPTGVPTTATLTWPAVSVPGVAEVPAGALQLKPPSAKR